MNKIIDKLELQVPQSLLFLGCNDAESIITLAQKGHHVTCVSPNELELKRIQDKSRQLNLQIHTHNSELSDFTSDKKFNAIISIHSEGLSHFKPVDNIWGKDMAILGNMTELLHNNARFAISVLSAFKVLTSTNTQGLELWTLSSSRTDGNIQRYYTPAELTRMVNRIGLKIDEMWSFEPETYQIQPLNVSSTNLLAIGHKKEKPAKNGGL